MFLANADPLEEVLPHTFHFGPLHVTNQMIMALVAALLMLWLFTRLFGKPDPGVPTGAKNFFESILEFLRIEVFRPALKEHTDRFVPFLWTLFFFILFCNILGVLPLAAFFELITLGHVKHLGGAATANISVTATLAVCAFFFIHANGISTIARALMNGTYGKHEHHHDEHSSSGTPGHAAAHDLEHLRGEGLPADVPGDMRAITDPVGHYRDGEYPGGQPSHTHAQAAHGGAGKGIPAAQAIGLAVPLYLWNFAPHPFRPAEGEPKSKWLLDIPLFALLLVLELIGAIIKPFALCMRLFANMVAGHAVLAVLVSLIVAMPTIFGQLAIGVPAGLLDLGIQFLELFVALLQAYIFTFLTTLFLASAVAPEH